MSSEQQQPHEGHGGWEPLPQGGEYEGDATAFVQLPDNLLDFTSVPQGADPLAAPGHGYVPPPIAQAHQQSHEQAASAEQSAEGQWTMPFATEGGAPDAGGQWSQYGAQAPDGSGHWQDPDPSAQWTVPPAGADVPDESGEYPVGGHAPYGEAPHPGRQHWTPGAAAGEWNEQHTVEPAPGAHWQHDSDGSGADYTGQAGGGDYSGDYGAGDGPSPDLRWNGSGNGWSAPAAGYGAPHDGTQADPNGQHGYAGQSGDEYGGGTPEQPGDAGDRDDGPGAVPQDDRPGPEQQQPYDEGPGIPEAAAVPQEAAPSGDHDGRHADADPAPSGADEAPGAAVDLAGPAAEVPGGPDDPAGGPDDLAGANDPDRAGDPGGPDTSAEETAFPVPAPQADPADRDAAEALSEHPHASYVLKVNGTERPVTGAWIGESLLYVLRERLGLAGAKDGCSQGECGACSVLVDGRLVASCLVPAATTAASEVRTVEGLGDGAGSDVQRALAAHGAVQCGFCVPGLAMTVHDLLEGNHAPTELETRQAISGNLCRCSGYSGVLAAVREVAAERAARAEQEDEERAGDGSGDEPGPGTVRIPHQAGPSGTINHPTGGPA
ncbi:2Fe-2S iron-sulfur cluster-binding protein [Streptomyces meridianus]|uniref:2Fe-2S iron-sulfur cluster-binding protein n=1 Tax=Streptomyces meridianus TaxID=2938945 RepID=A0ABT0X2A1_9ACTN|nr:2Fe-2S iron-sulfur cluster-binding protein [Streptomyces meridianus]MCM2575792.1 2Fe-2S iron-sulfur cluster-binding protein [Streptomyces meridianus]